MLIRNAALDGYPGLLDLRLMHGCVREIGVGLVKGLYEAEMDLAGDELRPLTAETPLSPPMARRWKATGGVCGPIAAGSPEPLVRWRNGRVIGLIHGRTGD